LAAGIVGGTILAGAKKQAKRDFVEAMPSNESLQAANGSGRHGSCFQSTTFPLTMQLPRRPAPSLSLGRWPLDFEHNYD